MTRTTHTFVVLEISSKAYHEIAAKLREAGYDHVFIETLDRPGPPNINMAGIALNIGGMNKHRDERWNAIIKENMGHTGVPKCQRCESANVKRDPDHGDHPASDWTCADCGQAVEC